MRTAGALAATGFILFFFLACSDDPAASPAPPVADGGVDPAETGPTTDAADGGTATPGAPKRGTRLAPQFRETSDGLSELVGMVDTALGNVPCTANRAEDGVMRCLPGDTPYLHGGGAVFADATCATRLAVVNAGCPTKPSFALQFAGSGCENHATVFDVGAQHTTQIYEMTNPPDPTSCAPIASDAKKAYYVVGAKRAATDFVKLTQRVETIAGGVGVAKHDGDDGSSCPQYQRRRRRVPLRRRGAPAVDVRRDHARDPLT